MTIKRNQFLYELTVRFNATGFHGAHAIDLERVQDGDEIIAEKELPARPITAGEFGEIMSGKTAELIEAADYARQERDTRVAEAVEGQQQAERDRETLERRLADLTADLEISNADLWKTKEKLDEAQTALSELQQINDAQLK